MQILARPWGAMHFADEGPRDGPALVLANSLGTDLRLWEALLPLLPAGLRLVRHDMRGHGLSDVPDAPYGIADLAGDAAALIAHLGLVRPLFLGLSIGGLTGQALAAAQPGLLAGLVISNSAARVGTADLWQARIDSVRRGGIAAIADGVMERWFAAPFREGPALPLWRNMLVRTPAEGYAMGCAAIAAADLAAEAPGLRLPVLCIAGGQDGATPPALVEGTARLIPGARFATIPHAGHLPCVEAPEDHAALITAFLKETGHA